MNLLRVTLFFLLCIPSMLFASTSVVPTADTVLPGSIRTVYSYITGEASTVPTWSASCGTLDTSNTGYAIWTAPLTTGSCTVTATSAGGVSANATFTIITATVRASNIPMQSTIFKNQPLVIQSILWGSTNTAVTWTNSGGTLRGTSGREVVFTASVAGTYTVKATSKADPSKSATTTIVVTNNEYPNVARANHTMPIDCTATGSGTTYNVTTEAEMNAVPWSSLGPGDTVRIHPGTYHKQILINTSGTETQPIRICGVPDASGNLPELNGANATPTPGADYNSNYSMQGYGGILLYKRNLYFDGPAYPKNIIIEGLKIADFHPTKRYDDIYSSSTPNYVGGVAPIRVQHGGNIVIRGNQFIGNGNGLFSMCNNSVESQATRNLLVEGNYFYNNGVANDYLMHQSYLQSFGLVVQGNYYAENLPASPGGQLKTRAVQQFIRYNYLKPAARMLDLVEEQDSIGLVFPWIGVQSGELPYTSTSDVVANHEAYQNVFAYGNILHNTGSKTTSWMVHGAADTDVQEHNYGGNLYFYYNTIYDAATGTRAGLFDFGPYQTTVTNHTTWPTAQAVNNAIYLDTSIITPDNYRYFYWNRWKPDRVKLGKNWVSSGWGSGNSVGGDGTGIGAIPGDSSYPDDKVWQYGILNTQVYGLGNLVTGATLPFSTITFVPVTGSPLNGTSAALSGMAAALPPLMQYNPATYLWSPRTAVTDMGAVGSNQLSSLMIKLNKIKETASE